MAGSLHHYCHTHNTVRWLKLTCMFFSNLHFLLAFPRDMYLKMTKTVRPGRPTTTHLPKHCINIGDLSDFICLSHRFLYNRCLIKLVSWGPCWVLWVQRTCTHAAFWFESLSLSEDKHKTCMLHAWYYDHYNFYHYYTTILFAIQDTMETS